MKWSNEYRIGLPAIDTQHKRLFELVAELEEAFHSGLRGSDLEKMLAVLDQYKTRHFQLEEKYMRDSGYEGLAQQQQAHAQFDQRFTEIHQQLTEKGMKPEIVRAIRQELASWLKEHVTSLDMEFGKYYQANGSREDKSDA